MLKSVDDIIEALGGTKKAAELFGVSLPAVSVWRANGKIPASYLLKFEEVLGDEMVVGDVRAECFGLKR